MTVSSFKSIGQSVGSLPPTQAQSLEKLQRMWDENSAKIVGLHAQATEVYLSSLGFFKEIFPNDRYLGYHLSDVDKIVDLYTALYRNTVRAFFEIVSDGSGVQINEEVFFIEMEKILSPTVIERKDSSSVKLPVFDIETASKVFLKQYGDPRETAEKQIRQECVKILTRGWRHTVSKGGSQDPEEIYKETLSTKGVMKLQRIGMDSETGWGNGMVSFKSYTTERIIVSVMAYIEACISGEKLADCFRIAERCFPFAQYEKGDIAFEWHEVRGMEYVSAVKRYKNGRIDIQFNPKGHESVLAVFKQDVN